VTNVTTDHRGTPPEPVLSGVGLESDAYADREIPEPERKPEIPHNPRPSAGARGIRLRHRPALDGLRGLAVASCLTYQMIPNEFTGGWLGIDMFLTLSGFFIAAMLLQEQRSTGSVHYWNFIKRRGRRLLPGHLILLAGTVLLSLWLIPPGRRSSTAGDIAASVVEMVNWRFISNDSSYFNTLNMPSPLRHMWSLSVQEQYYVLFPLVLWFVSIFFRTRWTKALIFLGLALLSMARMSQLYVQGTDPSRVYFGTDTRIFEVLIGVVAAFLLSERAFAASRGVEHRGFLHRFDRLLGWAGLAALGLLFFWMIRLSEYTPWLFPWGLAAVCGLTLVGIIAASSPTDNLLQRILSWSPLRWVGRMGFSLYIWHWPLVVFTNLAYPDLPKAVGNTFSMILTVIIAWLSNKYVETPIHTHGVKALFPSRPTLRKIVCLGAAPAILLGSLLLAKSGEWGLDEGPGGYSLQVPAYQPTKETLPMAILGNSVATGLALRRDAKTTPDLKVDLIASLGCNPTARVLVYENKATPPSTECLAWRDRWPNAIRPKDKQVILYLTSISLLADYQDNGTLVKFGTPEHAKITREVLDELRQRSFKGGAAGFVIANLACHQNVAIGGPTVAARINSADAVKQLNTLVEDWARSHKIQVIDLYSALCAGDQFHPSVNGAELYDDGVHYSVKSAPIVFDWIAPQMQKAIQARGTANDGLADLRK
jgi:peptidoglycan/LPS O-acetylase OafA/YrhL